MPVMVGVPTLGAPTWALLESLLALRAPGGFHFVRRGPLAVDVARNELVEAFLRLPDSYTHLLMVDSDAMIHPETLQRLLSWDQPLVGALAFTRYGPCLPTVYRGQRPDHPGAFQVLLDEVHGWVNRHRELMSSKPVVLEPRPPDSLIEVDRTGCHCVLIRRDVLQAIPSPWFVAELMRRNREDFYFFEQAQQAGFRVYVDLGCMTSHLYGDRPLAAMDHMVWDASSEYMDATARDASADLSMTTRTR